MVRSQVIEYETIFFVFKNFVENEAGRVLPEPFLFFKSVLYELSVSSLQLSFIVSIVLKLVYNKKQTV